MINLAGNLLLHDKENIEVSDLINFMTWILLLHYEKNIGYSDLLNSLTGNLLLHNKDNTGDSDVLNFVTWSLFLHDNEDIGDSNVLNSLNGSLLLYDEEHIGDSDFLNCQSGSLLLQTHWLTTGFNNTFFPLLIEYVIRHSSWRTPCNYREVIIFSGTQASHHTAPSSRVFVQFLQGHTESQIEGDLISPGPWPLVRERTIPTDRPPLVDEI
jgi:hypothetical protein